ncbi:hypothetical protein IKE98_03860 [Candidatus Saccharibacteria bacterium]|nr:hypothetical protein [Candidatus Saccharibacteria bacterium]
MGKSILERLEEDHPDLKFVAGKKFAFRPPRTIVFEAGSDSFDLLLLHEVGHALSGHKTFGMNIERLKMEVEAWEKARELADAYAVPFDKDVAEGELDTYRNWVHQKSRCPKCGLTRFEAPGGEYRCPQCDYFN